MISFTYPQQTCILHPAYGTRIDLLALSGLPEEKKKIHI